MDKKREDSVLFGFHFCGFRDLKNWNSGETIASGHAHETETGLILCKHIRMRTATKNIGRHSGFTLSMPSWEWVCWRLRRGCYRDPFPIPETDGVRQSTAPVRLEWFCAGRCVYEL